MDRLPNVRCINGSSRIRSLTYDPSIWGIADGARIADVDAEIVSYAVLDVLAKPVFGFWLLFTHDAMSRYVCQHSLRNYG